MLKALACTVLFMLISLSLPAQIPTIFSTEANDFFRVRQERKSMLKVNLFDLLQRFSDGGFMGVIHVGYEHKLALKWSINTEFAWAYTFLPDSKGQMRLDVLEERLGVVISPRYYYNINKLIEQDRGADNLSANYLTLMISARLDRKDGLGSVDQNQLFYILDTYGVSPMWGLQRRLLNHGYVDFMLGFRFSYGAPPEISTFNQPVAEDGWSVSPVTHLRMGVAF